MTTPQREEKINCKNFACRCHRDGSPSNKDCCKDCAVHPPQLLRERLKEANELLRSAYSVAKREGLQTNWSAFAAQIDEELKKEHPILYPTLLKEKEGKVIIFPTLPKGKRMAFMYDSATHRNAVVYNKNYVEFYLWDRISPMYNEIIRFPTVAHPTPKDTKLNKRT